MVVYLVEAVEFAFGDEAAPAPDGEALEVLSDFGLQAVADVAGPGPDDLAADVALHIVGEGVGVAVAQGGIFLQGLEADVFQGEGQGGYEDGWPLRVVAEDGVDDARGASAEEGVLAREHLVHDYAEREDVGGWADLFAGDELFRRAVAGRSIIVEIVGVDGLGSQGQVEIDDFDLAVRRDEDV